MYEIIESILKDTAYDEEQVSQWVDDICSRCMEVLVMQGKPYKYIGFF